MSAQPMLEIYTEYTPNPESLKFVLNKMLLMNTNADFKDAAAAKRSPMAEDLFKLPYVRRVFISGNFVTITKDPEYEWIEVVPEVKEFLKAYVQSGREILLPQEGSVGDGSQAEAGSLEEKIVNVLDTYVRPAVEMDGGNIQFKSFNEGVVTLMLQGSCSGCPSSTLTLKAGIEGLLQRMVPEVKEVVAEAEAA
ncbi:MAG: NifU family protein [Chitinophagales bacterium]|nr:NifU family protein [Chitinophagales bacterium]